MTSHTPGPWKTNGDPYVSTIDGKRSIAFCDTRNGHEDRANARLIAATPDMLSELKKLYKAYVHLLESGRDQIVALGGSCDPVDVMEHNDPKLRDTRDFITKVTGGGLEPVGSMGMPLSCGKPLCAPNDHHILCRLYKPQEAVIKPESGL